MYECMNAMWDTVEKFIFRPDKMHYPRQHSILLSAFISDVAQTGDCSSTIIDTFITTNLLTNVLVHFVHLLGSKCVHIVHGCIHIFM